ncbi:phosphoenolpyruvate mutase [Plastoroseomonas hellenica]|uniref:phosphoenolpyruvate mutase n=1 Tax=Plastoroseomonas hellenica TaxID=2687306 RepID=UPI001BA4702A|nr:phosphoenolpyruvate mutase [Plastoroseomonas hellenica]MBR0646660.1 phosphoenolpyruvate mutase [Plastoroseomonas hellenica]
MRHSIAIPVRDGQVATTRFAALRHEITKPTLSFLMEAHDGISAKIVEEAGFRGIWASGLTISASLGLRDSNEASWTQVLDVLEYMADASTLPILVDGDTGHGNFNNVRRFVRKLCERGIAGVCIEDKLFPKTNSFLGEAQPLADIDEFCGRIKAGKDSQTDPDFTLVARVEALISGRGMDEAITRAEAYHRAGADAILIHSKKASADEIFRFAEIWANRAPLIIVPTMYYATPTDLFRQAGISTIIWANHLLRSSITAMRQTAAAIQEDESLMRVEGSVATVKDIFQLVGNAELEEAERRYLPAPPAVGAVVLAAGGELGGLPADQPKCMVDIRGQSLLKRLTGTLRECGVQDVTVVRGYRKEAVALPGVAMVDNDRFAETGEAWSLACARNAIRGETVVAYGDVLFRRYILDSLLTSSADVVVAVDAVASVQPWAGKRDLVMADRRYSGDYLDDEPAMLRRMNQYIPASEVAGEWMGLARFSARGTAWLQEEIAALEAEGLLEQADMPLLLTRLAARHPVRVKYFTGHWLDVDTMTDLAEARNVT